jgi:hypothetical protein
MKGLSVEEAKIWRRVVSTLPPGWFGPECHDLLARYCELMARAEMFGQKLRKVAKRGVITKNDKDLAAQQRSDLRMANVLSTTLRFSPKGRLTSGKAQRIFMGVTNRPVRDMTSQVRPWEISAGNGSDDDEETDSE